jgi:hypothetical protein
MPFRGAFRAERLDDPRGELALERLRAGDQIVLCALGLRLEAERLVVTAVSRWMDFAAHDDALIASELDHAQARWHDVASGFPELRAFGSDRGTVLELVVDYDMIPAAATGVWGSRSTRGWPRGRWGSAVNVGTIALGERARALNGKCPGTRRLSSATTRVP